VREGRFASITSVVTLLAGVARGMEAVHAHKIIHLDLKPENILLSADNVPWVTDFGLSTSSNLNSQSTSSAGGRGTIFFKACAPRSPVAPQHTRAWEAPGLLITPSLI
jgi:serine/threonine protein kinase